MGRHPMPLSTADQAPHADEAPAAFSTCDNRSPSSDSMNAILTPDPATEGDHGMCIRALARLQEILSARGMRAHAEPWTAM